MRVEFQITFEEFWAAAKAHRPTSKVKIVCITAVVFAFCVGQLAPNIPHNPRAPLACAIVVAGFPTALAVFFLLKRLRYRHAWKRRQQSETKLDIGEAGAAFEGPHSRLEMKWAAFCKYVELPKLIMLYFSKNGYVIVPNRVFASTAELAEFKEMLRGHIQPPSKAFPVITPAQAGGTP